MTALASFEDFLYVIVGLLWIVFSFYNAKKKKDKKNAPTPKSEKKSILESLIDEIGLQDKQTEPSFYESSSNIDQEENEPDPLPTEETQEVFSYDDYYEESNYNSPVDVIERKPLVSAKVKEDKNYRIRKSSFDSKTKNNIDLRKAIIYSEILKKVYF